MTPSIGIETAMRSFFVVGLPPDTCSNQPPADPCGRSHSLYIFSMSFLFITDIGNMNNLYQKGNPAWPAPADLLRYAARLLIGPSACFRSILHPIFGLTGPRAPHQAPAPGGRSSQTLCPRPPAKDKYNPASVGRRSLSGLASRGFRGICSLRSAIPRSP